MNTINPTPETQRASAAAAAVLAHIDAAGLGILLDWQWSGRRRTGQIFIRDARGNTLHRVGYSRSTWNWNDRDRCIDSVRTGSTKHLALLEVLAWLREQHPPVAA